MKMCTYDAGGVAPQLDLAQDLSKGPDQNKLWALTHLRP